MSSKHAEILVYITAKQDRVLGGDALTLLCTDAAEQEQLIIDLGRALRANAVKLKNGDTILLSN